ncbi:DapH/DapD/GlmU-related protein [Methanospirillum sp.]|uniref:DapH/DapD/GlmU-related protein n=1 Tax=Methanospirillum sp. TaxID=45200 RepID=UPI0035A05466
MKISEFAKLENEIIQDCIFSSVGHLHGKTEKRLVPINSTHDLNCALLSETIAGFIIHETITIPKDTEKGILLSTNPLKTALGIQKKITQNYQNIKQPVSIHPSVYIHPTAIISDLNVNIGKNVKIHEHVIIHENSQVEENTIIGPNSVIGSIPKSDDFNPSLKNYHPHGSVEIKKDIVIHANCCIERPWFQDKTTIGQRCQIDNLVTIRQGAVVDDFSLITANSEIGEYASIGKDCWIGLRSSIHPGVNIGDSCYVTLGSKVTKDISPGMVVKDNWSIKRERFKGIIT